MRTEGRIGAHWRERGEGQEQVRAAWDGSGGVWAQNLCLLSCLPCLAQGLKEGSLEQRETRVWQEQTGAGAEVWRQGRARCWVGSCQASCPCPREGPRPPGAHLPPLFPRSFCEESTNPWPTTPTPWWSLPGWFPTTRILSEWGPGGCGQGARGGRRTRREKAVIATTGHDSRSHRNLPIPSLSNLPTGSEVPGSCPQPLDRGSSDLS